MSFVKFIKKLVRIEQKYDKKYRILELNLKHIEEKYLNIKFQSRNDKRRKRLLSTIKLSKLIFSKLNPTLIVENKGSNIFILLTILLIILEVM
jgi:hypothetical protein